MDWIRVCASVSLATFGTFFNFAYAGLVSALTAPFPDMAVSIFVKGREATETYL